MPLKCYWQQATVKLSILLCQLVPRNNKERLNNDILALFVDCGWKWTDGGNTHGKNFIRNMCDAPWYLDGHHATFEDRSCPIREPFSKFHGYNVPEKSKHRKREHCNLSYDTLVKHVSVLQEITTVHTCESKTGRLPRDKVLQIHFLVQILEL